MPFWTEILPPKPAQPATPAARRLIVWLPTIVAIAVALAGLATIASQQSATNPPPIIRDIPAPTATHSTQIDLNTATAAELATLPGIGPSRAEAIILLRAQQPFSSLADLADRGILRPAQIVAIADLATVYVALE